MPRTRPPHRLHHIVERATDSFLRHGFRRTQMADVARSANVSAGTVYLYASSKDALFELALRRSLGDPTLLNPVLPFPSLPRMALVARATELLEQIAQFPELWIAAQRRHVIDPVREFQGIVRELLEWSMQHRRLLGLIDRSAADWPEMAKALYSRAERPWIEHATAFLVDRSARIHPGVMPEPSSAAGFVFESVRRWVVVCAREGWSEGDLRQAGQGVSAVLGGGFLVS